MQRELITIQDCGEGPLCVLLPGLCGTGARRCGIPAGWSRARRLWPGLPAQMLPADAGQGLVPDNLPLAPSAMRACVAEAERYARESARDATGVTAALERERASAEHARLREELAAVEGLATGQAEDVAGKTRRLHAQQMLGWYWLQQKDLAEIDGLLGSIGSGAEALDLAYGRENDEEDEESGALRAAAQGFAPAVEEDGSDLEPDWRACLAAAIELLPEGTIFACEGAMAREVRDMLDFVPAPELAEALGAEDAASVLSCLADPAVLLGPTATGPLPAQIRLVIAES